MHAGRRLTVALATIALALAGALAGGAPAGAATEREQAAALATSGRTPTPPVLEPTARRTALPTSARAARPLFAFWGKKYNRIDGFGFITAARGSGTGVKIEAAWKTYRGVKPILPKVFVQSRTDGGKWTKVKGVKGRIGKDYVSAKVPAHVVPAGVAAQQVDYRLKTKKPKKGPRRARRSVSSDPVSVRFENQSMYAGDQLRFYNAISSLCPNAIVTLDPGTITEDNDAVFSWQYGITIDTTSLAASPEPEAEKLAIAVHECAHMKQFYLWGGTNQSWKKLVARSAEVFVADTNPDPNVATPPMDPEWAPLEHAADCATRVIYPNQVRTYGGYCNPTEMAAAGLLWQDQKY
jgi:hypothetical protein